MTDTAPPEHSGDDRASRLVQGILRLKCQDPAAGIQLMPSRSKAGFFLLESHLQMLQQASAVRPLSWGTGTVKTTLAGWLASENRVVYLSRADWGAFHWVDELFDDVLASVSLDPDNLAMVNRLRLPVVHYVLKEPRFFSDRRNICRRFLDTLLVNLMSTRSAHAREVRFVIGGFVARVLETFQGDIERFNSLCLEAQQWFAIQHQRSHQLHLKLQERVRRDLRNQKADERVSAVVERCLGGQTLPDVLVKFLRGDWRDFMLVIARGEEDDSALWKRTKRMTEAMVEIAVRSTTPEAREHYERFLPPLIKGVNQSLDVIQADDLQRKRVSRSIELIFGAVLLGSVGRIVTLPDFTDPDADNDEVTSPLLPPLMAEDWVRIRTRSGGSEICSVVIEGDAHMPWVFVGQRDGELFTRTTEELRALEAEGLLDIIGTWRPFESVIDEQVRQVLASTSREELLREPPPDLFASLPVATHIVTSVLPDPPIVREATRPPVPERTLPPVAERTIPPLPERTIPPVLVERTPVPVARERTIPPIPDRSVTSLPERALPPAALERAVGDSFKDRKGYLTPGQLAEPAAPVPASVPSDEALQVAGETVDGLEAGARLTWYRSGGEEVPLTLSVRVRATGRYILVNRAGARLLAPDRDEFASRIASGELAVIDAGSGFDSTLEKIVKHIQKESPK